MKIRYRIFIISTILISSCTKIIELDVPNLPPQIVVNGLITSDSVITVSVQKTHSVSDPTSIWVDNAEILLYAEDEFIEQLDYAQNGEYRSLQSAQVGINYTIKIDIPAYRQLSASTKIPEAPNITDGILYNSSYYDQQMMTMVSEAQINFTDSQPVENYYQISFYTYSFSGTHVWDDSTGTFIPTDSTRTNFRPGSYMYSNSPIIQNENDIPYYHDRSHIKSLVFSDELLEEINSLSILTGISGGAFNVPVVVLRSISVDYYLFHKSLVRQNFSQGPGSVDVTNRFLVSNPNDLYSNIENGLGIFAAYSETQFELTELE